MSRRTPEEAAALKAPVPFRHCSSWVRGVCIEKVAFVEMRNPVTETDHRFEDHFLPKGFASTDGRVSRALFLAARHDAAREGGVDLTVIVV